MPGFWTQTEDGRAIHVNGNPNMSEETRLALVKAMDVLVKQVEEEGKAFGELWDKVQDTEIDKEKAAWWFNEGIEYQVARSRKRIEYLERRLREEIEAHRPPR
jgi:hypothetical protein